ncbi:60S ribosomal protein L33-B [Lachnellula cervina]|uniref:60S ribosomal protein L33-B n=1 Tax=Lachnellula cervina TaxID=1316786 RepID=A0A7D8YTD7_9HELO|nr:60S ribosomal protein L33-B [Lachnellula cervina]
MPTEAGHRLYVKEQMGQGTARDRSGFGNEVLALTGYFHRGRHLSYQRGKRITNPNTSLIKLEGVDDTKAANFYLGKKVAFVYRAHREVRGSKIRVIWGTVTRPHGNSGVVRAQFRRNLPPKSFGASVRVMLYPSSI